jgi:assimilatory nitrate reductase electron transfer subunit
VNSRVPRVVVVGNGMAGFRFVQELLGLDAGFAVTVVAEEPGSPYNRVQLTNVLAGTARADSIELADEDWYAARGVRLVAGVAAARIDRAGRLLELADGSAVPYDILVLAVGSAPVRPAATVDSHGRLVPGAVAFRTLADYAEIRALAADARCAVVLGGGVLGLETACGLAASGLPVTLVQRGPRLMERQLDAEAARMLARTTRSLGVAMRAGTSVRDVRPARSRVTGIVLDDGESLDADLLVLCCGSRPRTGLAGAAGLAVGTGVVVDDQMRSVTDPGIFAIGDCAEHRGRTHGLVAPAWAQARVAARAIASWYTAGRASQGAIGYFGSPSVIRLKAAGIELATLGSVRGGGGAEVIRFTDPSRGVYQKLVVRGGRLAGAIMLGDTRTAGTITQLFDRGAALPADRSSLLVARRDTAASVRADSPLTIPGHATICQCNGVTKAAICAAWQDGAKDPGAIAARTRASTGCGTCRDAVEGIVAWLAAAEPVLEAPGMVRA